MNRDAMWAEACRRAEVDPAHVPDDLRTLAWQFARGDVVLFSRRPGMAAAERIAAALADLLDLRRKGRL